LNFKSKLQILYRVLFIGLDLDFIRWPKGDFIKNLLVLDIAKASAFKQI